MQPALDLSLDRAAAMPLGAQIHSGLREAIRSGRLAGGTRLPSWRDLAASSASRVVRSASPTTCSPMSS